MELIFIIVSGLILIDIIRKFGFFCPASIFIGFLFIDYLSYFYVTNINRLIFSAMPYDEIGTENLHVSMIYGLIILLIYLTNIDLRPRSSNKNARLFYGLQSVSHFRLRHNTIIALGVFSGLYLIAEVAHFIDINKSVLWFNTEYLSIANPSRIGISNIFILMIHNSLRPFGIIFTGLGTFLWIRKYKTISIILFLLAIYPFVFSLAANSRWAPLFFLIILVVKQISYKQFSVGFKDVFLILAILFSLLMALVGRGSGYNGIAAIPHTASILFSGNSMGSILSSLFVNIFQGAQNIANSLLINPHYPTLYKLLSFSPGISAIDGYKMFREQYQIMITPFVPINAYSEAFLFGWPYFLFFLSILLIFIRAATRIFQRYSTDLLGIGFLVIFYWLVFELSQYGIRHSMRFIYLELLIYGFIRMRHGKKKLVIFEFPDQ